MSEHSSIEWTESTWNPVTGCVKVSPGCKNCYAEKFAERWRGIKGHHYEQGFDLRLWPDRLKLPLSWKTPRKIFVNSMSDLFMDGVPDVFIDRVFMTMTEADAHQFQLLTKRPERLVDWSLKRFSPNGKSNGKPAWPDHVWIGVSIENQNYLHRLDDLRKVPARIRFVSFEPLLGPIRLHPHDLAGISWVIVGGESGAQARPMREEWIDGIMEPCRERNVPFFFKQWGAYNRAGERVGKGRAGRVYRRRTWDEMPLVAARS